MGTAGSLARPVRHSTYISSESTFAIHYDTAGTHSPDMSSSQPGGTPDWVVEVAAALDSSQRLLLTMGFDPALPDNDTIYDVYLTEYGGTSYGETHLETLIGSDRWTTYMEMDNDFAEDEIYFTHGLDAARTTAAHNYFHAVQIGYGLRVSELFFYELSSTWFEEVAFPEVNDWIYWYNSFRDNPTQAMNNTNGYSIAIFGHYLTETFGVDIIRQMWDRFKSADATTAVGEIIASSGGDLTTAWIDFVARLYCNGRQPEYYFHADQDSLDPPVVPTSVTLVDSLHLVYYNLEPASAVIQAVEMVELTTLKTLLQGSPQDVVGRAVLETGGTIWLLGLTGDVWRQASLDSGGCMILVVGGGLDSLVIDVHKIEDPATATGNLEIPAEFYLHPNFPNPFNPASTIQYDLPEATDVTLTVYDLLGREVVRLVDSHMEPGYQQVIWTGRTAAGRELPSGIYIARLVTAGYSKSIKMLLLK